MPARFNYAKRVELAGDEVVARRYVGRATVLLANLVRDLAEQGHESGAARKQESDITYDLNYQGNIAYIRITAPTSSALTPEPLKPLLWIPKGIVVQPANADALNGWGLPVVGEQDDVLVPAMAPENWTPGGNEGQVLLTKLDDAGYPDREIDPLPMYYDNDEQIENFVLPTETDVWNAYRLSFRQEPAARAVVDAVNAERPSGNPLSYPYRGFADLAIWCGAKIDKYGFDTSNWPPGSQQSYNRIAKDGTAREVATHGAVGSMGSVDASSATTPSDVADILIAALPDLGTDTTFKNGTTLALAGGGAVTVLAAIDQTTQWVRCGNIDWKSIHEEVPRISWTGPRGRSVPSYEMVGGIFPISALTGPPFTVSFSFYFPDLAVSHIDGIDTKEFDRFIYARGRILAQLPNSGYCLGAAIQKLEGTDTEPVIYRLIAIAWHRADQKFIELNTAGLLTAFPGPGWYDATSDIRVWFADMPARNGLACAPDRIIDDLYDATTNPTGWHELERYRLADFAGLMHYPGNFLYETLSSADQGYTDNGNAAPKTYWQTWMFNGSGTEAVCLRADAAAVSGPAIFWSTGLWPSQMLRLTADADRTSPTTSIVVDWEIGGAQGVDEPNGEVGWEMGEGIKYIAADYAGDELHVIKLEGSGSTTCFMTDNGTPVLDLSARLGQTLSAAGIRMSYLDARSLDFIYLDAVATSGGNSDYFVRAWASGAIVMSTPAASLQTVAMWGDFNAYQLSVPPPSLTQCAFGVHTNPAYFSTTLFSYLVTDTPWARYDGDYVGGGQFGLLNYSGSWTIGRLAAFTASSMDAPGLYEVNDGWPKFAGVV